MTESMGSGRASAGDGVATVAITLVLSGSIVEARRRKMPGICPKSRATTVHPNLPQCTEIAKLFELARDCS